MSLPEPSHWPMFFIRREGNDVFLDPSGQRIAWQIKNPVFIDWSAELALVQQTMQSLTPEQIRLALYWGTVDINQRISSLIFGLIQKYGLGSPHAARILGYSHAAINDAFVICWHFKYLWDVARPVQYDSSLRTVVPTPRFPAYPSAHAAVAGCAEVVLSRFFPQEAWRIRQIMEAGAQSRLYAGVHFKPDNDEGLQLGRQIGRLAVQAMAIR